jgi:NAD(P)-dependent dehydrogenase (short-subunit alcohol dehydrogenase family)
MGLAVANALSMREDWEIHILDINSERGVHTATHLPRTTFHHANVTKYSDLAAAFQSMFQQHSRLDFVFANAGVIERTNFYSEHSSDECPPEPDLLSIDADLKGVIFTSYLAQHYFHHSPDNGRGSSLVMTASCGGLYPSFYSPLYSAAKCETLSLYNISSPHTIVPSYDIEVIYRSRPALFHFAQTKTNTTQSA